MIEAPSVCVVLVNFHGLADTLECLESMKTLTYGNYFTIVVDNASGNDEAATIAAQFPDVEVMPQTQNLGFTGGNNVGMRRAMERGAQYIFLLNNDTTVSPQVLDVLVSTMEKQPNIGACGPLMLYYDEPTRIASAGSWVDYKGRCFSYWQFDDADVAAEREPIDVTFVWGSGLMLRRAVLESVGLLDDRFFLNYEEVDLCARILEAGHRVVTVPRGRYWHKISRSITPNSALGAYYLTRNRLLYLRNRRAWPNLAVAVAAAWLHVHRESNKDRKRAERRGLRDFLIGRFGYVPMT